MAKVIFGPTIAEARNKQGSTVFTRNRYGAMTRTLVQPSNVKTPARLAMQTAMTSIRNRWSTNLTDAQRTAWAAMQAQHTRRDVYAQTNNLQQDLWFMAANLALYLIGQPPRDDPPAEFKATDPGKIKAFTVDPQNSILTITPSTDCPSTESALITASKIWPAARYAANGRTRVIIAIPGPTAGPLDIYAAWLAKFGPANPAGVLFVTIEYIHNGTGGRSGAQLVRIPWPGGPDMLQQKVIQLTSAQILDLYSTNPLIIPAPPPGKIAKPQSLTVTFHAITTPYTPAPASKLALYYNVTPYIDPIEIPWAGLIDQTADTTIIQFAANQSPAPTNNYDGTEIRAYSAGGSPTAGDGTLTITVNYTIDADT